MQKKETKQEKESPSWDNEGRFNMRLRKYAKSGERYGENKIAVFLEQTEIN